VKALVVAGVIALGIAAVASVRYLRRLDAEANAPLA
jgi:hypothetical protein